MLGFYGTVLYFTVEDKRFRPMGVLVTILTSCLFGAILKEVFVRNFGNRPAELQLPARPRLTVDEIHCLNTFVYDRGEYHCKHSISPLHETLDTLALEEGGSQCVICLSDYEKGEVILELPCGHCYHMTCVALWLVKKAICPICKAVVTVDHPSDPSYTAPAPPAYAADNDQSKLLVVLLMFLLSSDA